MKLYVIRHGESENNLRGCFTGWAQARLTQKGIDDARGIRAYLKKIDFDKIYTSDLIRAMQTAETALPGCVYEPTPLLREINLGELNGKSHGMCLEEYGDEYVKNRADGNFVPYGGEDNDMIAARAASFLEQVSESGYERVAAFAHAGMLRTMLRCVMGVRFDLGTVQCSNCTIAVFEHRNRVWQLKSWLDPQELL